MAKRILIISGGSTTGKSTLANKFIANDNFSMYKPLTTRESRKGEIYFDYRHVSKEQFKKEIESNSFFFHDFLFNNYYGIKKDLIQFIKNNSNCLFIIPSWRMADLISCIGKDLIAFHIISTQTDIAKKRLVERGEINQQEINDRILDLKRQNAVQVRGVIKIQDTGTIEEIYNTIILNLNEYYNGTK